MSCAKSQKHFYTPYLEDILRTFREDERRRIQIHFRNPKLAERRNMLDFMKELCNNNKFSVQTLHLGNFKLILSNLDNPG